MGYQIIKQPDQQDSDWFAVFDHGTDTFAVWNATADEVVSFFRELTEARAKRQVAEAVARARDNVSYVAEGRPSKAYHQFTKSWDDAVAADTNHGGDYSRELGR
jgi:hypothetical protein